jgi:hypothetical protein
VAGTYTNAQAVTIATTTSGAWIRYTTDGSTPGENNGTVYTGPVNIGSTTTLQAIAFANGISDSPVISGTCTMLAAAPVFSPAAGGYAGTQSVAITSATSGVSIRYTTDGSTPTETTGNLYSGPLTLSAPTTLTAIAFKAGFTDSAAISGSYVFFPQQVAAPTFSPLAGTYTGAQTVAITSATSGALIAYTMDGSTPTESAGAITHGLFYYFPLPITKTTALNAIAYKTGSADSAVMIGPYTINQVSPSAPTFSPGPGTYAGTQTVAISSATSGALIIYTTDGSTPAEGCYIQAL